LPNFVATTECMADNPLLDNEFYLILGNKIRLARKEKGLDQESLAKCLNLTRTSVINIEKGRQRPSVHQIWLIAFHLQFSITELIPAPDIQVTISNWTAKVQNHSEIADDAQKKIVLSFISATRNPKS
jgi:transcriptional regulator with XRE-family HTH domain